MCIYEVMLKQIILYSKENAKFNASTFYGIYTTYSDFDDFTDRQKSAISNVYEKWKIEKWYNNRM